VRFYSFLVLWFGVQINKKGLGDGSMSNKLEFKLLSENAKIPQRAHAADAGLDLVAVSKDSEDFRYVEYGTGLAVNIPDGYVGLLFPRSSVSLYMMGLANSVGVIDSGYTGEIKLRFRKFYGKSEQFDYLIGDKVGQLVILKLPEFEVLCVDEFSDLNNVNKVKVRGDGGFGSSN